MDTQTATAFVDATQVAQYQADGFLVVRQVFGPERIAELEAEAERVLAGGGAVEQSVAARTPAARVPAAALPNPTASGDGA